MSGLEQVDLSIIVPAYNEGRIVIDCLKSLTTVEYPRDKYEIIVVNDGSVDNTADVVRAFAKEHPNVILMSKTNGGKGSALNYGLSQARGNLVLITDADTIVPPNWASRMSDELSIAYVVVGACYLYLSSTASPMEKIQAAQYLINFRYGGLKNSIPSVGANIGFRKSVAHELTGFSTTTKSITAEFIKRVQIKGYKIIFNPDILVHTRGTSSFINFTKQKLRWRESSLYIIRGKVNLYESDIIGLGYTDGLSFILFVSFILSAALLNYNFFIVTFILILVIDILLYIKALWRMWRDKANRSYVAYFLAFCLLMMIVRLLLTPYLIYHLIKGIKPSFDGKRD